MNSKLFSLAGVALFGAALQAQEFRGTVSGVVTDSTGASVASAKVLVVETHTRTKIEVVTEGTGQYTAPFLLAGDYDISVKLAGFKEAVRKGVHVGAGDHVNIDMKLEIGDAATSVSVTAEAPMVNNENASVGSSITTKEVEDLPLNGGSPLMLAQLETGVIYSPFNSASTVLQSYDSSNNFSIAGTPTQSSEMLLDGAPNATWDMRSAYTPPKDAVQEVRVKVLDTDAAFGHTRGGTINQVLKTGTNQLHGSLWEYTQPSLLTANSFFNNRNGLGNPVTHFNQYGLQSGGPVRIPKVYNGTDKLFWFFAWQNDVNSTPFTNFISVPTPEERTGDFSLILRTDKTQLYDPYSGVLTGTTISRSPLPNNQIPASRINPIAVKYLQFYPQPNVTGGGNPTSRPDGYNNYGTTAPNTNRADNELGRLDYNMSIKNRVSGNVRHNSLAGKSNNYFQNVASGRITSRENWGASLDDVYMLSPSSIFNVRLNYTYMYEVSTDPSVGFDSSSLGFPGYLAANSPRPSLPYVYFDTSTAFQFLGYNQASNRPSQSAQLYGSWMKVHGNQSFRAGAEIRQYRLSTINYAQANGGFNFGGNRWVNPNASSTTTEAMGQDMAQFLYGLPTQGFFDVNTYGSWYSYFTSYFVQDDWRARRNLTFNFGMRFDHDGPFHEKYGRTENGWLFGQPNPIAGAARAAYDKSPIPQIAAGNFQVPGGLLYPSGDGAAYKNTSHLISPRFGVAWSPGVFKGKTVIRSGFGMFVAPITIATLAQNGNYSSQPIVNQEGFSQQTQQNISSDNYLTPATTLSDPFPGGSILKPNAAAVGPTTFLGSTVSFLNPEMKSPYSMRWNFGFQQTLASNMMLEVNYIGNHSVHTPVNLTQLNGVPRQYLSTSPVRDNAVNTALSATVPNPFRGLVPASGTPGGTTTSVGQLLAFYPEYPLGYTGGAFSGSGGVLEQNLNVGSSYFHSLNVRAQKRLSGGLMLIGNYIFSKLMEQTTWLNDTDPRPEKRIGVFDHTHRGVFTATYELPIGRNKWIKLQSRWANTLGGGWNITGIYTLQTGQPYTWMGTSSTTIGDVVYYGGPLNFNARQTDGPAFDTTRFATKSADQFAYHVRTFSTTFSSLRGDFTNEMNASVLKKFAITAEGRTYFQIRGEVFNVMNHHTFAFPNLAPTNSAFGLITSQSNRSRQVQIGARLVF